MGRVADRLSRFSEAPGADVARTARLLLDGTLQRDPLPPLDAATLGAVPIRAVPPAPVRTLESALKHRLGPPAFRRDVDAAAALRRRVLGDRAAGPPRFLVRVDEFPHYRAWDEPTRFGTARFRQFHEIMHRAGVSYLIAALPRVSRRPLDPGVTASRPLDDDEQEMLAQLRAQRVQIALHGRDHRSRSRSPRRHSELGTLDPGRTAALLDAALAEITTAVGERPEVFVAPYNRFTPRQWPVLAERFTVVGGGPESIRTFGIQPTPRWRGEAVYLPAYPPLYGRAREVIGAVQCRLGRADGLWTPIVLHWGWEADAGWDDLERLAGLIAPHAVDWADFLAAVRRSR